MPDTRLIPDMRREDTGGHLALKECKGPKAIQCAEGVRIQGTPQITEGSQVPKECRIGEKHRKHTPQEEGGWTGTAGRLRAMEGQGQGRQAGRHSRKE